MALNRVFVAIDLGAESGRVVAVELCDQQIQVREIHRFQHAPIELPTGLHWDVGGLWREIVVGLRRAAQWSTENSCRIVSVGVDAWGVDWALLNSNGELCGLPHAYRDPRNASAYKAVIQVLGVDLIYKTTGIQMMPINTLCSLFGQRRADERLFSAASRLLFIPDLMHYWLSGQLSCEQTIASTSQMIDVTTEAWASKLLEPLGIRLDLLMPTSPPGTSIGTMRPEVSRATTLRDDVQVVLPPSHDTASAVAAIPAKGDRWAYLSSGTWSLLGVELDHPCVTEAAQSAMFTNESGVNRTIRFLKNIAGLWLVQQCRKDFQTAGRRSEGDLLDYDRLTQEAADCQPFRTLINTRYPPIQLSGAMTEKINDYARQTGQPICESPGQFVRCCLESLSLEYGRTAGELETTLGSKLEVMHVVGGGSRNQLLNQMAANALGIPVVAGPVEATAIGNALVQAMAAGDVRDSVHLRQIVANSTRLTSYEPLDVSVWRRQQDRYRALP
jgi:rhamnulokinase